MKRIAIAVCVVILVLVVAVIAQTPAQSKSGSVEQELIKLEKDWANALVKADLAFIEGTLADDYISTDSEGSVGTKNQEIATLKSGDYVLISTVLDNFKVHVYGDAAVYSGRSTDKAQFKGKDISGRYQWTDTWVKRGGCWQCVASHGSRIAQK
jgi:mRNA-degrading endonuclease RelE of RelBE toxin-antitoxin system